MDTARSQVRQRIIEVAGGIFFSRGFAKVTVDEIAAELGISKKTLYQHFAGKDRLLQAVVRGMINDVAAEVEAIVGDDRRDFIDQLIGLMRLMSARVARIGSQFADDLRKHAPELWREVERFRHRKVMANFGRLVRRGQAAGAIRGDVDPELLTVIYAATIQGVVNPRVLATLPHATPSRLFQAVGKTMFVGILTERAKIVHFRKLTKLRKEFDHA
ncbi:MAG: TetR/AcrR family transcriptional regulator [Candidatus Edwardsbacteria bacterium]|jgi:AcrR family transcriptional regulator|nr:TetR/AcrR family transcriptional regulator [Candidatus Edwardsbacteria bacterium]